MHHRYESALVHASSLRVGLQMRPIASAQQDSQHLGAALEAKGDVQSLVIRSSASILTWRRGPVGITLQLCRSFLESPQDPSAALLLIRVIHVILMYDELLECDASGLLHAISILRNVDSWHECRISPGSHQLSPVASSSS